MGRYRVITDLDILRIAVKANQRFRARLELIRREAADLSEFNYVQVLKVIEGRRNWFTKADFIATAREYLREREMKVKIETLLRKLRKMAEAGEGIKYVDRRKGIYELVPYEVV